MDPTAQILVGVIASLVQSGVDAFGLNLQKRSHVRNSKRLKPRNECMRLQWHVGLYLYIISQLLGSVVVLRLLKTEWAAPLGAVSLIFNFLFAYFLVGTKITKRDIFGTIIVMASVLAILFLGAYTQPPGEEDSESNISLESLKENFSALHFKIYFILINVVALLALAICLYSRRVSLDERRLINSHLLRKIPKKKITRSVGIMMSIIGGIIASETLLLAKSAVLLIFESANGNPVFNDPLSITIVVFFVITAVLQFYCLNAGIKFTDSVVASPIYICTYNVFGLSNSMFYFNLFDAFPIWVHIVSAVLVLVLCVGVFILAFQEKVEPNSVPHYCLIGFRKKSFEIRDDQSDNAFDASDVEKVVSFRSTGPVQ